MPVAPRFRPGSSHRPFVDREEMLDAFDQAVLDLGVGPHVFNLIGVGGIGKSRLLLEFAERVKDSCATAVLDLQVPAQRQPENALAALRTQLGEQEITFHRFDIAFAVLWQRLNPMVPLTREGLPFAERSEVLTEILGEATGVPVFGTAVRLMEIATRRFRKWRTIKGDEVLSELDRLSLGTLIDAVIYVFALELRKHATRPFVIFIDAYEAMVGGVARQGKVALTDAWLRDLVAQLDAGLVVIASREPLRWERHDAAWTEQVREVWVSDLPVTARHELLAATGISDPTERRSIANGSAGLPFYLHLAIDARARLGQVVSPDMILERFLHHVEPAEVRMLELLSVARTFDHDIFTAIAEHYDLPGHAVAWQSLTSYSFVSPAGHDQLQLHQLMVNALRRRVSTAIATDIRRLLGRCYAERFRTGGREDKVGALREAAYHGLYAGDLTPIQMLDYADKIMSLGGKAGVDGMLIDLRAYLADHPHAPHDLQQLAMCLAAEGLLLLGDASAAAEITSMTAIGAPTDEVSARLAVAVAQAQRILGNTDDALRRYLVVWEATSASALGKARLLAGHWAADLHMAQGRFVDAVALAARLRAQCPPDELELLGDIARLEHLARRFAFDVATAASLLEEAQRYYAEAGTVIGLSNLMTNRAELLAVTDPEQAIEAAVTAIARHRESGVDHELGKSLTALAIAYLKLGRLDEATRALDDACAALDRAGYRSGRARTELYRGMLHARAGRTADAVTSVRWAVDELAATRVYPTLILVARELLDRIGRPDVRVDEAAQRALVEIQPLPDAEPIADGVRNLVDRTYGDEATRLYTAAVEQSHGWTGFYNRNIRVGDALVRIPINGADVMDLAIWPEYLVLATVCRHLPQVPRLRTVSLDPPFQIHEFVAGKVLDDVAPKGTPLPDAATGQIVEFLCRLGEVPTDELPLPSDWPDDGDTGGLALRLVGVTASVHARWQEGFSPLWRDLGIPADPLAIAWAELAALTARPFCLVHADVHRKNIILSERGLVFLDWELALFGDPVYDLATHLHKMVYVEPDREAVLRTWAAAKSFPGWAEDLHAYLRHERVKSAIVDSVRYAKLFADSALSPARAESLVDSLTAKLTLAHEVWDGNHVVERDAVAAALRLHSGGRRTAT